MEKESVIISEGERPVWQIILAAFFYTLSIFFIAYICYVFYFAVEVTIFMGIYGTFWYSFLAFLAFIMGLKFSAKNIMFFDLKNRKFKDQIQVGPFKVGKWKDLPKLDYISIFGVYSKHDFEINLWYNKNKYANISTADDKESAFELGFRIANQLNIKLLDATEKNNFKYLDMNVLREKYK